MRRSQPVSDPSSTNGASPYSSERLPEETWPDARAMPRSFFGAPLCQNLDELDAQVALIGVPFDQGVGVPGARFGPDGLRDARTYAYTGVLGGYGTDTDGEAVGYYDIDTDQEYLQGVTMADCGNISIVPSDVERNFWKITRVVRKILDRGAMPVAIGG